MNNEVYLTDRQLAERYGIHRATVWKWAKKDPKFPEAIRFSGSCTRFKLSAIEKWEELRAKESL